MDEQEKTVTVDVEAIMEEIRANARLQQELKDMPTFEDIPIEAPAGVPAAAAAADGEPQSSFDFINSSYLVPYYWPFTGSHLKAFCKRVVRKLCKCLVLPIVDRQNAFNAAAVRCLNHLRSFTDNLRGEFAGLTGRTDAVEGHITALRTQTDGLKEQIADLTAQTEDLAARAGDLAMRTEDLAARAGDLAARSGSQDERSAGHERQIAELREQVDRLTRQLAEQKRQFDHEQDTVRAAMAKMLLAAERAAGQRAAGDAVPGAEAPAPETAGSAGADGSVYTVLDYFKFQNDFRGTSAEIKERQRIYLPYFKDAAGPVLDIGCGRGEFLSLMKDNRIPALGVDLYPEYVMEGRLNGLEVHEGDGITFLQGSAQPYGGIFSAQVIEHISFVQLQELCASAYEKLLPGGYLVLETPNPACLSTFTSSFYMDPTHNKPVHPFLLQYLLKEIGFSSVEILYTEASRVDFQLPPLRGEGIENLEEVNAAVARVSDLLYGSLDYAVIAKK